MRAFHVLSALLLAGGFPPLAGCPSGTNGPFDADADGAGEEDSADPAPFIEGVNPGRGPTSGGMIVEVTGGHFQDGIAVFFGTGRATEVDVRNPALLTAATPPGEPGPVTVRVENPDGQSSELAGGFRYVEEETITWCVLDRPEAVEAVTGAETAPFYGIVELPGRTDGSGRGDGIEAQAGYGPDGSDPEGGEGWTWTDAEYGSDVDGTVEGDLARDEYEAAFTVDDEGSYDVAFRFSSDGGATWTICDMSADDFPSYSPDDAAALDVSVPPEIDFCILLSPVSTTVTAGEDTEEIHGKVRVSGHTDTTTGEVDFITAEIGYGPDGSDPSVSTHWQWKSADWLEDSGMEDEYGGALTAPDDAGGYDYAYRFSVDGGSAWTYCDTDGSENGYDPSSAGSMTVEEPPETVDWCNTQSPPETWTGPGFPTDPLYGRVFRSGSTEGSGEGPGIDAQVGWGARGSDPSSGGWTWVDADYFTDVDYAGTDDADEYVTDLTLSDVGDYSYTYRFSADGGSHWTYCDLDGTDDGFETDMTGYLRVVTTTVPIDWCNTQHPHATEVTLSGETEDIYGQVYSDAGGTSAAGRTFNIIAELGYGPDGSDPASAAEWSWKRAYFNVDVGNNDEFMAVLSGFPAVGEYDYAYRFTGDWGATWTYCDTNGSDDGYAPSDAGALTVN